MDLWGWAGVAIGVVATLVLGVPPLWFAMRARRSHVRQLWVRAEPIIDESGGWQGGRVTITNGSDWPMWDVIIESPDMGSMDFSSVGPGEFISRNVSADLVPADELVTVQVTDARRRMWLWTPLSQVLSQIPPPTTPLAKLVQFIIRHSPELFVGRFHRLPESLLVILWGYHPERGDGVDHLSAHVRRAQEVRRGLN
jgi:hypothetical protein